MLCYLYSTQLVQICVLVVEVLLLGSLAPVVAPAVVLLLVFLAEVVVDLDHAVLPHFRQTRVDLLVWLLSSRDKGFPLVLVVSQV